MPSSRTDYDADIVVVGAGPAGCAAALALRGVGPGLTTILIDAPRPDTTRVGEVLPAAGFAMLRQLGIDAAVAPACRPAPGLASLWGSADMQERPALFSMRGADRHLDRALFDRLLVCAASDAGAVVRSGVSVAASHPIGAQGAGWSLLLDNGESIVTRMAIWATGRRRGFLRRVGGRAKAFDRLAGYTMRLPATDDTDPRTLLEAAPDGWWYAAPLPSGDRAVAFMTDADIGRTLGVATTEGWRAQLAKTQSIGSAISGEEMRAPPTAPLGIPLGIHAAYSSLIDPVCGADWLAAGDAASCFEPLASQGIARALRSGCFAGYAAFDMAMGRREQATTRYAATIGGEFHRYRAQLSEYYAMEQRWRDRPFWSRR